MPIGTVATLRRPCPVSRADRLRLALTTAVKARVQPPEIAPGPIEAAVDNIRLRKGLEPAIGVSGERIGVHDQCARRGPRQLATAEAQRQGELASTKSGRSSSSMACRTALDSK